MFFWFVVGLVLLTALVYGGRWYANAPTAQARRVFKLVAGLGVGLIAFMLLTRTGLAPLFAGFLALLPMLIGLRGALRSARAAQGPSPGGASTVLSAWFEMALDHETGDVSGRVLQGAHRDRDLDDLSERELDDLAIACADDANSSRLLAAYMARRFGRAEPDDAADAPGGEAGQMPATEALAILGLEEGADADAVNRAYKRLIALAHPDRGGSAYLAAKINQARSTLLSR